MIWRFAGWSDGWSGIPRVDDGNPHRPSHRIRTVLRKKMVCYMDPNKNSTKTPLMLAYPDAPCMEYLPTKLGDF